MADVDPEFKKRIHLYQVPPADFDPLTATARRLEEFRLPARPGDDKPDALAFWLMLFSPPLRFVEPSFDFQQVPPPSAARRTLDAREFSKLPPRRSFSNRARFERSQNWSGVYLRAEQQSRFTSVNAAWTVPDVDIPAVPPVHPDPGDPLRDEYRSSIWLGLNGYRSYPHVTMPQLGTWQRVKVVGGHKVMDFAAWWQWWSQDEETPIVKFDNLPVAAGNLILAGLVLVSNDEAVLYIKNQSSGDFTWLLVQAPAQSEPLGATAEWIVERPTTPDHLWPWRLPKFADVEFSHCHALAGPSPVGPQSLHGLERARFIRMQERFANPYRSAHISIPERLSTTRLTVRYREG